MILFIKVWDLVTAKVDYMVNQLTEKQYDVLQSLANNPPSVTLNSTSATNIPQSATVCQLLLYLFFNCPYAACIYD